MIAKRALTAILISGVIVLVCVVRRRTGINC